jgi:uncharacterized protein YbjQ (UPF0145 family)
MAVIVSTTFTVEGFRIASYKGIVRGLIVRAPTIMQGIFGGLKSIVGGQIGADTEMCEQTRQQAYELMIDHARAVGANAVVVKDAPAESIVTGVPATWRHRDAQRETKPAVDPAEYLIEYRI